MSDPAITADVGRPGRLRLRAGAAWKWWSRPWRSPSQLLALVVAFAAPPLMVSSAGMFAESAGDQVVEELVTERPQRLNVTVTAAGMLTNDAVDPLDDALSDRFARVEAIDAPRSTWFTEQIGILSPSEVDGEPPAVIPGSGLRLFASRGAVSALDLVAGSSDTPGVFVSTDYADDLGLAVGDDVMLAGAAEPVSLAGIFVNLWEVDGRDSFWDQAPSVLVPRFSRVFGDPLFEIAVLDESVVSPLGVDGVVRWDFDIRDAPSDMRALDRLAAGVRGIERDLTESAALSSSIAGFSGFGGPVPSVSTDLFDLRRDALGISAELDQPIATTAVAGVLLGIAIAGAGAGFVARRRRIEFALLWSDGEPRRRFALRALAEYAAPAALGVALGLAAAWAVVRWLGPSGGARVGAIDLGVVVAATAAGLAVASLVTGTIAGRPPSESTTGPSGRWLFLIAGLAAACWVQVGAPDSDAGVDLLVVLFPIVGTVAGVGAVVAIMRWLLSRFSRSGQRLPAVVFLAWRRVVAATTGASAMAIVIGTAMGLVVFPQALIDSLGDAARAKAATIVGGQSRVQVLDRDFSIPPRSTLIQVETTRATIGDQRVRILAIDTASYAEAVTWDVQFGSEPDNVVELLSTPVDAGLPAVLVGAGELAATAGFGTQAVVEYTVVGSLESAPLASSVAPTLIIDAAMMEAIGRERHELRRPSDATPTEWADEYVSLLASYRRIVVSDLDLDELLAAYDAVDGGDVRDPLSLDAEVDTLDARAPRWAFEYFRLLSAIAAVMAAGGLLLYLGERRASRELADAMAIRMGFRRIDLLASSVLEVLALVAVAFASGVAAAFIVARRVFARFEPDRTQRPNTTLLFDWSSTAWMVAIGVLVTLGVVVAAHTVGRRRSFAEVLGDS